MTFNLAKAANKAVECFDAPQLWLDDFGCIIKCLCSVQVMLTVSQTQSVKHRLNKFANTGNPGSDWRHK